MPDVLQISGLTVEYNTQGRRLLAVDNATLHVHSTGSTIGVVGESGSGKTTLGMSIMNLIEPPGRIISGRVDYAGTNVLEMSDDQLRRFRWREISMVYQSAMNSLNPVKNVSDHIVEVFLQHKFLSKSEASDAALKLLSQVGIREDRARDYPHEFSGGMRQRVVIAMALALSPKLLIADEPTSALDVVVQRQILSLIRDQVARRGLSLLFITHEIALLRGLVNEVAVMYRGGIVERGPVAKVLFEPLHPYTEMLVGALLTLDTGRDAVTHKVKVVGEPTGPPPEVGCRYANRCPYVFLRCHSERPELREVQDGRWVSCHKYG